MIKEKTEEDLYALFKNKTILDDTCKSICDKIFHTTPVELKQRYLHFRENISSELDCGEMFNYLFFSAHLLTLKSKLTSFNSVFEYQDWVMESSSFLSPYFVLSIYYTVQYLLESSNFYLYRSYINQNTHFQINHTQWDRFIPDPRFFNDTKIPNNINCFNLSSKYRESYQQQHKQTQFSKELKEANSKNPLYPLINYKVIDETFYFINGFLSDLSVEIAHKNIFSKRAYDNSLNRETNKNTIKTTITNNLSNIFDYYGECLSNIDTNILTSFSDRMLRIIKLEYGMGIITLSQYLKEMSHIRYDNNKNTLESILSFQKDPRFPDRLINNINFPTTHDELLSSITLAKYLMCICYILTDKDLMKLKKDLQHYIDNKLSTYKEQEDNFSYLQENPNSPQNLWRILFSIDDLLQNEDKKHIYFEEIKNNLTLIKEPSWYASFNDKYWKKRFSDEWWNSISVLYSSSVIKFLSPYNVNNLL